MAEELDRRTSALRGAVATMGDRVDAQLSAALGALRAGDLAAASRVIDDDRVIDQAYEQLQHGVLATVALHQPVGLDLRQLTAMMHVSLHLERMGDYAASVARTTRRAAEHTPDEDLLEQLIEMGELARTVGQQAVAAFVRSDLEQARALAQLDDAVDRLNTGIFQRLVRLAASDEERLRWATRMIQLTRTLERYADHGVDIGEQAVFATTGEVVDLDRGGDTDRDEDTGHVDHVDGR